MRLAFAGGGTGGHLFPGLAVAELAVRERLATEVCFFGASRGIESRLVPQAGYELVTHDVQGLSGSGPVARAIAVLKLGAAVVSAMRQLRKRRIDVVVGLGGYASAPGVIAARLSGIAVVLLEQNRVPGMANRKLSALARAVCVSFEETMSCFPEGKCTVTGNPLRGGLEAVKPYGERTDLLVFGGSSGASNLNKAFLEAATRLGSSMKLPPILHQAGAAEAGLLSSAYRGTSLEVTVEPFIDDMASAYGRARLAVCRAGATTIAELAATSTPSILVPYPGAGEHQRENAVAMVEAGAAVLVEDRNAGNGGLAEALEGLLHDQEELNSMSAAAGAVSKPGATSRVLEVIKQVAGI